MVADCPALRARDAQRGSGECSNTFFMDLPEFTECPALPELHSLESISQKLSLHTDFVEANPRRRNFAPHAAERQGRQPRGGTVYFSCRPGNRTVPTGWPPGEDNARARSALIRRISMLDREPAVNLAPYMPGCFSRSTRQRSISSTLKRQSLPTLNAGNCPVLSSR